MDRKEIVSQLLQKLKETRGTIKRSADRSKDDMVEAESAMQSRYSSAKEESEYLYSSLQSRLREVDKMIAQLESHFNSIHDKAAISVRVSIGSIVFLYEDGAEREDICIVLPGGGGTTINTNMGEITVVTPQSLIGQQLIGLMVGGICNISNKKMEVTTIY